MTNERLPRVAVLGVHGVAHHIAGETVNAIADLLLTLPARPIGASRDFDPFRSVGVEIPMRPLEVGGPAAVEGQPSVLNVYEEQSVRFSRHVSTGSRLDEPGTIGDDFTRMLLHCYEGGAAGNTYVTSRLEGKRKAAADEGAADVHIYEVLWADLASPNNSLPSFFLALFQLLLHLATLSRLVIDTGSGENHGRVWSAYRALQRYAVRMLQIFLPLFKVILLIVIFSAIPALDKVEPFSLLITIVLPALAGIVISFLVMQTRSKPVTFSPELWALLALIPAALGAAFGAVITSKLLSPDVAGSLASWIILGVPLLHYILSRYEDVRKGVRKTGWIAFGCCFLAFLTCLYFADGKVLQATFWMVEIVVALIRTSWLLMFAFAMGALVLGSLAWRMQPDKGRKARLRAAVRTSRLALALPAVLFLLVTSLIWAGIFKIAQFLQDPYFPAFVAHDEGRALKWLSSAHLIPQFDFLVDPSDYLKSLQVWSLGYELPLTLLLFFAGLFLLVWWALPGAITEGFPLRNDPIPPRNSTNAESVRLGTWLSRGLDATSVVTFLLWFSIFLLPPIFYLLPEGLPWVQPLKEAAKVIVFNPVLATSGALLALAVRYGSSVLGIVLDVDTYLRDTPTKATPRAKIIERYVSTLRYLAEYRDLDGRGYDSVVIIAHSLGALISTDLLHFLHHHGMLAHLGFTSEHPGGGIELKLMTMGNPMRQLLNRFFPYLYDWVRPEPDNSLHPLPPPTETPAEIRPGAPPDPAELGVSQWVNTYRSGDYVGRSLWLEEWYCRTDPTMGNGRFPQPIFKAREGRRLEMCIGAGAHTHYWDDTAPDVAKALSQLI